MATPLVPRFPAQVPGISPRCPCQPPLHNTRSLPLLSPWPQQTHPLVPRCCTARAVYSSKKRKNITTHEPSSITMQQEGAPCQNNRWHSSAFNAHQATMATRLKRVVSRLTRGLTTTPVAEYCASQRARSRGSSNRRATAFTCTPSSVHCCPLLVACRSSFHFPPPFPLV